MTDLLHAARFRPFLTPNEVLIWTGRSSFRAALCDYVRVWIVSVPAAVLCLPLVGIGGVGEFPFRFFLGLTICVPLAALLSTRTYYALTHRRALFLMDGFGVRRFASVDLHPNFAPWVVPAPCSLSTVFLTRLPGKGRRVWYEDSRGNVGFWRIDDGDAVAARIRTLSAQRRGRVSRHSSATAVP